MMVTTDMTRRARQGFTMIELMVAIVILGLLMAGVGSTVMGYLEKARKGTATTTIKTFRNAIEAYELDTNELPKSLNDLIKKPSDERIAKKWMTGGYIKVKTIPNDPWGSKYQYRPTPGAENPYELYSYGSKKGKNTPQSEWISAWDEN